jgi:hypothetical protein
MNAQELDELDAHTRREQHRPFVDGVPESLDPAAEALLRELMTPLAPERAAAILDRVVGPQAVVLSFAPPRPARSWRLVIGVSLAMAAAAALFLLMPDHRSASPVQVAARPSLEAAAYDLTLLDAPGGSRGADVAPETYTAGDPVILRLRPRDPVPGPLVAKVRAIQGTRELALAWVVRATSDQGHLEIEGVADDLLSTAAGVWQLEVTLLRDDPGAPLWRGHTRLLLAPGRSEQP